MSQPMYGVVDGVYYCQMDRTEELSQRMASRNVPSAPLQPEFSIRPTSTKYAHLNIFDVRPKATVPIQRRPDFNIQQTFNPGNAQAPWSGFATNIDNESSLRNQFFALQNCEQSEFVPSSNSDMYQVKVSGRKANQPFPDLFVEPDLAPFNPNSCDVGKNIFANHTRQQLKSV